MKKMQNVLIKIMVCLIMFGICPVQCFASESDTTSKVIRVGWYEDNTSSQAREYTYQYLQALAQYTGWTFEYVKGSGAKCQELLRQGEIDLLGFVSETEAREKYFAFPTLPMAVTSGLVVTKKAERGDDNSVKMLDNRTIGIINENAYNEEFEQFRLENNLNVTYRAYESAEEISPALERGEIFAAVIAEEERESDEWIIQRLSTHNRFFVTNTTNYSLFKELDEAMRQVYLFCPDLNSDLTQKYFETNFEGKPVFNVAEQEFIRQHKKILVLYDSGWPPVEYYDEEDKTYKGISPDLFKLLSNKCGIDFVFEGSTSGEVLSSLKQGDNRNTLTTISYDYKWAEQHNVHITQPFVTSSIVKLGRNLSSENPTIAINEKAYFTFALQDFLKDKKTKNYAKQEERLEAVRTGKADYTFVTEDQANYYRSIPKYRKLAMERMVGFEQSICVSIEKNSDPELISIISKGIASISHDQMTEILSDNTVNTYKWTLPDYLYAYRVQLILASALVLAVVFIFIILLVVKKKNEKNLRRAFEQKKQALILAQEASEAKGSFMSRMSHEIRTPLNAVIGYNTIARGELTEANNDTERRRAEMRVMDCLAKSDIASRHLLTIINDVLDMSAIESGKIKVSRERFDFKGMITSLTTIFYTQAKTKNIDFEVIFDSMTEEWFIGDQLRVNQILTNLLSNAIKFTPEEGKVTLTIEQPEKDTNASHIHFEVKDTGIGMAQDFIAHLWAPFEQADASISRRFGGTGLGMTITKSLVDIMGGEISVESKLGVGTKFCVDLTFERTEQPTLEGSYDFSGINALIVDDDSSTCDYIKLLFERCGARCSTATSGQEAIEAYVRTNKEKDAFSLCMIDWRMPGMDGIETIRRIREIAGEDIPIIVITAYDFSELADKAAEVGVNMFISKPLFQSSLFNLLAQICGRPIPESEEKNKKYRFQDVHVLLTEDNNMNMEIAKRLLESTGITVDSAWNGKEAVGMFEASKPGTYDLILMDIQMPVMSGHEAVRILRQSEHADAKKIPVVAMTADAFAENIAEALEAGMNEHISKPIEVNVLFEIITKYLPNEKIEK